jgi:hypothetical protein
VIGGKHIQHAYGNAHIFLKGDKVYTIGSLSESQSVAIAMSY